LCGIVVIFQFDCIKLFQFNQTAYYHVLVYLVVFVYLLYALNCLVWTLVVVFSARKIKVVYPHLNIYFSCYTLSHWFWDSWKSSFCLKTFPVLLNIFKLFLKTKILQSLIHPPLELNLKSFQIFLLFLIEFRDSMQFIFALQFL